jgi:hypothetical protein
MAADLSRVRLNPLLDYAGVELKQGAVLLDADANELVAIIDRRLRALASDTLGRATVSATTPLAFKVTVAAGQLAIAPGRLYVDGLLAEHHGAANPAQRRFDPLLAEPAFTAPIDYLQQPYLPAPPPLPTAGRHLVYLDVWDRDVTHLEQPALVESAVAVETSSRRQTVWQVRVLADDAGSAATCATPDADLPGWAALTAPSSGVLSTGTFDVAPVDDPCELPPTGGYRGLENQLYRVEVHDGGALGSATFKWSRENASVGSRVASVVSASELELETLGRDDVLRLNSGDWVEIVDDVRELSQASGEMRRITVNDATRRITFSPALPAVLLPGVNLRVRRWDQRGRVYRTDASGTPVQVQDLDAAASTGVITVPASATTTLLLEDGITVRFDNTGAKGFKAGDFWVFAARTADASVELLDRAPPRGLHHHYARLGLWDVAAGSITDCRHPWPPAGGGEDCGCTACVTPESHASGQLTIQAAVDRVRDSGGTVCLHAGQYVLQAPVQLTAARSVRITGQGPATVIVAPASAFVIERSSAIAIERLAVFSLGRRSAIVVRTALGLALRELAVAVFGGQDAQGAAVSLAGVVLGAAIERNLLLGPDGVRALDPKQDEGPAVLLTGALHIDDNVFVCRDSAVLLDGAVGHALDTRVAGNTLLGTHEAALSLQGLGLPGAAVRLQGNTLAVHGPGIRCAVDGAWIDDNRLKAARDGERVLRGHGIALTPGLDQQGPREAQVRGNVVEGFPDAGIAVQAAVQALQVRGNVVFDGGHGIVVTARSADGTLAIEDNQLRDLGTGRDAEGAVGIGVTRAQAVAVHRNVLRRIGTGVVQARGAVAGILMQSVRQPRIGDNTLAEIGPADGSGVAADGIAVHAPYTQAEVRANHVERDAAFSEVRSDAEFHALLIDQPRAADGFTRKARYTTLRLDERRTLVLNATQAFVQESAAAPINAVVLGNVLAARGRVPAVDAAAADDLLFNDNRCEQRSRGDAPAVLLTAPVALVNANRVRGGDVSIRVSTPGTGQALCSVIGNITTGKIDAPMRPEMTPLNLIG